MNGIMVGRSYSHCGKCNQNVVRGMEHDKRPRCGTVWEWQQLDFIDQRGSNYMPFDLPIRDWQGNLIEYTYVNPFKNINKKQDVIEELRSITKLKAVSRSYKQEWLDPEYVKGYNKCVDLMNSILDNYEQ